MTWWPEYAYTSKRRFPAKEADLGANTIFADKLLFIYYLTPQLSSIILQPECSPLSTQTSEIRCSKCPHSRNTRWNTSKRILPSSRNEAKNPHRQIIFKHDLNFVMVQYSSSYWVKKYPIKFIVLFIENTRAFLCATFCQRLWQVQSKSPREGWQHRMSTSKPQEPGKPEFSANHKSYKISTS